MIWKDTEAWFKGAADGLIIALLISVGLVNNVPVLTKLASVGLYTCYFITQCAGDSCIPCLVIALMLNIIYGFILGAIIGYILGKIIGKKKNKTINKKSIKRRKKK